MGKRGPTAKGEYLDKSQVLSTRISAELRTELVSAAKGKTLSREIEHRLRRTFAEDKQIEMLFGGRRNFQLMRLIASVIDSTVNRKVDKPKKQNVDWLDDPYAFDQAVRAIATVLRAIRPPGAAPQSADEALDQYGGTFQGAFNAIETFRDVQKAPVTLVLRAEGYSRHQMNMANTKQDIGDLADRALIRGRPAEETRKLSELGRKLAALRKKQAKTPEKMTAADHEQMIAIASEVNAIAGEIEPLQQRTRT